MPGENVDITSEPSRPEPPQTRQSRSFLGVQFHCCGVYARIYMNADATAYVGHCPRCNGRVEFTIGAGGTDKRFFTVY